MQQIKEVLNQFLLNNTQENVDLVSHNTNDTINIAKSIAEILNDNIYTISLDGELGAGKTVFVTGFAEYYNIQNDISSPTFTIVNEYYVNLNNKKINIYHFDVYRIQNETDFLESIGDEYFSNGICIVEWGKNIQKILPVNTLFITIKKDENDENIRYINISRRTQK
ncbi:MAG: tRNA (adenosine(37)-N6)-threonylcarbamoyltransferase complex ATPase subunit type 1 TsaE [Clostridia bacterium]|nr:tRNA (adenosine(37)-N6)-threonylcarbamoyltransferase complex ATPase subunit type 1 TsaE [Clostridia bacterium]